MGIRNPDHLENRSEGQPKNTPQILKIASKDLMNIQSAAQALDLPANVVAKMIAKLTELGVSNFEMGSYLIVLRGGQTALADTIVEGVQISHSKDGVVYSEAGDPIGEYVRLVSESDERLQDWMSVFNSRKTEFVADPEVEVAAYDQYYEGAENDYNLLLLTLYPSE